MQDLIAPARALRRTGRRRVDLRVPRAHAPRRRYPAARDGSPRIEVRLQLPRRPVVRRARRLPLLRRQGAARQRRGRVLAHGRRNPPPAPLDGRSARGSCTRRTASCRSARRAAHRRPASSTTRETLVFPHYSLLEGHDRFAGCRSPTRKFQPLHRESCGFPSPVELFEQLGARPWFAALQPRAATRSANTATRSTTVARRLDRRAQALLRREGGARSADVRARGPRPPRGRRAPGVRPRRRRPPRVRRRHGRCPQLHRQQRPAARRDRSRAAEERRRRLRRALAATATSRAASTRR